MSSGSGASSSHHEHGHIMEDVKVDQDSGIVGSCSKLGNVLRKDENFKKFDIVEDISDHHYAARRPASMLQASPMKTWARKIREEWRILNKDLPEGTPYHDGLFFFDVCFPSNYPFSPPHFEGFVIAHFRDRAHAILMSGKAYCKGVRVGCVVDKGEGRSRRFKSDVEQCMKMLAREFEQIGVKGMEEFKRGDVDDSLTRKIRAKRVFPGSSSSMEAKLEVSSPPVNRNLKRKKMSKQNEGGISSALGGIVELDSDAGVSNSYDRKDYMDFYADDYIYKDEDEDAILKSYFDNIDLPTGVEASLPGFYDSIKMKNKMTSAVQDTFSSNGFMQSTHPDYARLNLSSMGSPNLDTASHKHNVERLPLRLSGERTKGEHATVGFSSSACPSLQLRRDAKKVKHVKGSLEAGDHRMSSGSGASSSHNTWLSAVAVYPQVVDPKVEVNEFVDVPEDGEIVSMEDAMLDQDPGVAGSSSSMGNLGNDDDDVLRKDQKFKKFDIVKDHSCHHYAAQNSSMMQASEVIVELHFEDLVIEHFRDRAHAILMACKAYRKGVRVGCVADDKGKDKQEGYSWVFRSDVERCMKMLVEEFKKIGVKDMEES
ncbi:Ubiquitin-conjugating enzyme, E2, partial [Cynara cardunculus var. scolymus]